MNFYNFLCVAFFDGCKKNQNPLPQNVSIYFIKKHILFF